MAQTQICRGTATNVKQENGELVVRYHSTDVVTRKADGTIILKTGGWRTNTTRTRQNQAAAQFGLGYRVQQKDYSWYVHYKGVTLPFDGDEITLPA